MLPQTHIILSFIFVIILKFLSSFTPIQLLIIFLAAVFIDVDHWFIYVIKKKSLSIPGSYKWFLSFEKLKKKPKFVCIFHTIECFIILILLSKILFFQLILIGFAFHNLLDIIDAVRVWRYDREISLIYGIFKYLRKK